MEGQIGAFARVAIVKTEILTSNGVVSSSLYTCECRAARVTAAGEDEIRDSTYHVYVISGHTARSNKSSLDAWWCRQPDATVADR
jgi:hypothetical protein